MHHSEVRTHLKTYIAFPCKTQEVKPLHLQTWSQHLSFPSVELERRGILYSMCRLSGKVSLCEHGIDTRAVSRAIREDRCGPTLSQLLLSEICVPLTFLTLWASQPCREDCRPDQHQVIRLLIYCVETSLRLAQ
jgi:hypothetical protein